MSNGPNWDGPYFRSKVVVVGTAVILVGVLTCVFAFVQILKSTVPGDYVPSIVILAAAVGLIAIAMAMLKSPK